MAPSDPKPEKPAGPAAPIWAVPVDLDALRTWAETRMVGHLGIRFTAVGPDFLTATMPVDERTQQPFGILHGGASVVLAETLGSTAGSLCVDPNAFRCVGLEINANHVRAVAGGVIEGTARPIHLGRRTQVWEIRMVEERGKLVCISRLTLAVLPR